MIATNHQCFLNQSLSTELGQWDGQKNKKALKLTHLKSAFVGKKTSAMIMSLNICYFYSHTFLQARGKDKRNRFYLIFFNPSWRVVLKRNRMFFSIVSFLEILIQENRGLK